MDFSKIRIITFLTSLVLVSILFLCLIKPIAYPIFWAAVFASIFHPLHEKLKKKLKSENLSAAIILVMVLVIAVIALTVLSSLLIKQSIGLYGEIGSRGGQINTSVQHAINLIKHNPITNRLNINESFWIEKVSEVSATIANFIFVSIKNLTQNSLIFIAMFAVMLFTFFYFIRDGAKFLKKIMYLCPLGDEHEIMFYKKFTSTARAAIKGTLVIGIMQGLLGGMLFYVTGIEGALIWGLAMMAFSVLIGCYLIWVPAGIIMLLLGNIWQGIFILTVGILVISTIDNILRPMLIGRDTQLHPLLIFLSTLGGVLVFGLSGFVIGPVIVALLQSLWAMYEHYYRNDLTNN